MRTFAAHILMALFPAGPARALFFHSKGKQKVKRAEYK
jgi:hypothetical protein